MGKHYAVGVSKLEGPGRSALESLMQYARGYEVLLDRDAAEYFQVELKTLSAAVKRQQNRFPSDCMLVFSGEEAADLERRGSAKGSSKRRRVLGFTEVGIEMLAGVLKSKRAVEHSVETIRNGVAAFARIRSRMP